LEDSDFPPNGEILGKKGKYAFFGDIYFLSIAEVRAFHMEFYP